MSRNNHLDENHAHDWAYRFYAGLGSNRSYRKVAREMGVPLRVIRRWALVFGWQERLLRQRSEDPKHKIVALALMRLARSIVDDGRQFAPTGW